ncbi:molecular chaperone HtpG [Coralloluteibacterium thermophilus]|uniref:Chaperone protein HtpG n=1 Tax=Coralloluteibacterium thermophilum TaxID=2707049 RepID=A0ABV9NJQ2_9GAMM
MTVETHSFQAEVKQVLHLVIHSLYSNKDIFLRELVSNASDACDKLRFEAIKQPELLGEDGTLAIDIRFDPQARTVTIADNGIGMSREELAEHLGTIARSGTKKFLESLSDNDKANAQLIGQFGVGFYSAFIVADRVTVTSRRAGSDQAWTWASAGDGEYTIAPAEKAGRGTAIVLHLREGEDEYLNGWKLRSLVHKYSEHIDFPIRLPAEKADADEEKDEGASGGETLETVNEATALWTRPRNEISDDDYKAFYKHVSGDFGDPLVWTHNRVEGNQNFTSLLFVPARAPFDFMGGGRDERKGLKLYIKRVFIMDAAEQMLPPYLRFVRGVVDSDDLPLNVSRELLQSSRQVERIKGALTKRVLDLLEKLAREEAEKYAGFWKEFGATLKEGVADDPSSAERLMKLLRFPSTQSASADELVSLEQYVERMKPGQEAIYYLTADGWNAARNSPQLEALKARGIEVLLMHERIDEWMAGYLTRFADKPFRNVAKGELDLEKLGEADGADARARREEAAKAAEPVVEKIKAALGDRVKEVKVSTRLTDSASCLVLGEYDMALHMQRLLKAAGQMVPGAKPVLEINATHPLVQRLASADEAQATDLALLLFEQAQVAEGAQLDDPAAFVQRVNRLLLS